LIQEITKGSLLHLYKECIF